MNYVGRKDGGKYISSNKNTTGSSIHFDTDLLVDISYVPEIAEMAKKQQIKYREAFIMAHKEAKKV